MNMREKFKQIQTETTCLELAQSMKETIDDFYVKDEYGVKRVGLKLKSKAGEIHVLYSEINLLYDKLLKMDKNLGNGII